MDVVASPGAVELAEAEANDFAREPEETLLAQGSGPVAKDTGHEVTERVRGVDVDLGHDLLERDGLAFVADLHLPPRLVVVVVHARTRHVANLPTLGDHPAGEVHVLHASKSLVKAMAFPEVLADGGIGVVAEELARRRQVGLREVLCEQHVLAELGLWPAFLAPVRDTGLTSLNGSHQSGQPIRRRRDTVTADENEVSSAGDLAADIQGTAEGEVALLDMDDAAAMVLGDLQRPVLGTGIDEDNLPPPACNGLFANRQQHFRKITGFVVGANHNTRQHATIIPRVEDEA